MGSTFYVAALRTIMSRSNAEPLYFCLEGVKVSIGFPGCSGNKFYLRISEIPLIRIV